MLCHAAWVGTKLMHHTAWKASMNTRCYTYQIVCWTAIFLTKDITDHAFFLAA